MVSGQLFRRHCWLHFNLTIMPKVTIIFDGQLQMSESGSGKGKFSGEVNGRAPVENMCFGKLNCITVWELNHWVQGCKPVTSTTETWLLRNPSSSSSSNSNSINSIREVM